MTLARWNPFREMEHMLGKYDPNPSSREMLTLADWAPMVDISENDEEFLIKVELPEVKKEDVTVVANDGVLTLRGERKSEKEEKNKKFHRVERAYGSFARSFTLPDNVDAERIQATYKNGMLYLHLAKTEAARPKSIEIKVA